MTPPLRLPQVADALADFARDLQSFTVEKVAERVGERAVAALDREDPLPAELAAAGADPLAVLIRLFLLGGAVSPEELGTALPRSGESAREWGIITGTTEFRAGIDLRPTTIGTEDVWLAADLSEIATGRALPAEHVLGLGGASATLALEFAGFNLALSDAMAAVRGRSRALGGVSGRVELREGSFFEPLDGEFDLIVSNPPFVVSPRSGSLAPYTYRDGGRVGDGVVQHLMEHLPTYLRPGGVAQMLANWEVHQGQQWDTRIGQWARATGIDAWIIQREYVDPAHYVHTWIRDGGLTPDRDPVGYRNAYTEWLTDFDSRGVEAIAFGYVILRKPETSREPWVRLEEITGTIGSNLGDTVSRTLENVESLTEISEQELLTWRVMVAADVTEERHYLPGASDPGVILLRQGGGLARAVQVDTLGAAAVGASDGELTLGQICEALAHLLDAEPEAVAAEVLPTIRGLLIDGILLHRPSETDTLNS